MNKLKKDKNNWMKKGRQCRIGRKNSMKIQKYWKISNWNPRNVKLNNPQKISQLTPLWME
jgi:hypothetical protein